jgi:hypothetical protein
VLTTTIVSIIELRIKLKSYSVSLEELEKFFKRKTESIEEKLNNFRKSWEENFNKLSKYLTERIDTLQKDVIEKYNELGVRLHKESTLIQEELHKSARRLDERINHSNNDMGNIRNELHASARRLDERLNELTHMTNSRFDVNRNEMLNNFNSLPKEDRIKQIEQQVNFLLEACKQVNIKLEELKKLPNNENIQKGKRRIS